MTKGAWRDDWQRAADEKAELEARIATLEAALLEAAARLRVAAIAGGSDPWAADLAVEKYTKILDSSKETKAKP
jgi:hypothetical protein